MTRDTDASLDILPRPDPSTLTTSQIKDAVRAERDYIEGQLETLRERLRGIDKATSLLNDQMTAVPTDVDKQVSHLKELHGERFSSLTSQIHESIERWRYLESIMDQKFDSVSLQFAERDTRGEREARDNTLKVDAAFAAQEKSAAAIQESNQAAILKSETTVADSIVKLNELFQTSTGALGDRIEANTRASADKLDDMKERLATSERSTSERFIATERSTSERFTALERLFTDRIGILEQRVGDAAANRQGGQEQRATTRMESGLGWQVFAAIVSLVVLLMAGGSLIIALTR